MALLPFANESVDVRAAELARTAVAEGLRDHGYRVLDFSHVDSSLRELGFTDGGQLGALPHATLAKALPADLYGYGVVAQYGMISAVALTRKVVSLKLRLLDQAATGVFAAEGLGQNSTAGTDAAGALAVHLAGKVIRSVKEATPDTPAAKPVGAAAAAADSLTDADLRSETRTAVKRLLETLPTPEAPFREPHHGVRHRVNIRNIWAASAVPDD